MRNIFAYQITAENEHPAEPEMVMLQISKVI